MENKKEKLEDFKAAISSTVRSLSNSQEIEISFGNQAIKSSKNSIRLPDLEQGSNKLNYEKIRAIADSKSLNLRFSNVKTLKKYEPEGNISKKLSEYIKTNEPNNSLTEKISDLYRLFLESRVLVSDFHPGNLLMQMPSVDDYQLVMIDGYGNSDFIKICDYSRFFLKKKLMRKFTRMLAQLGLPDEGIC